jgi:hypothetical protein
LSNKCYEDEPLSTFLSKFPLNTIISELLLYTPLFEELLKLTQIIGRHPTFFSLLLFGDKEPVSRLITSNDPDLRKTISLAISANADPIVETLKSTEDTADYVNVIFYLLYDPEAEIGLAVQRFLYRVAKVHKQFFK